MRVLTKLKLDRVRAGLTCADLAKAVGVSRTHLTLVENERRAPSRSLLLRVRRALREHALVAQ